MQDSLAINDIKMSHLNQIPYSVSRINRQKFDRQMQPSAVRLVLLGLCFYLFAATSFAADAENPVNTEQPEAPRWFEIEVILFKLTSDKGLTNESWDKEVKLEMPQDIVDFLQPYQTADTIDEGGILETTEQETSEQDSNRQAAQGNQIQSDKTNDLTALQSFDANDPVVPSEGFEEVPFTPLDESNFQLNKEAQSIDKNSRYQLVAHIGWRQPVESRGESQSVRIAGGIDYQDTFEYDGSKKAEELPAKLDNTAQDLNLSEMDGENDESMLRESDQYSDVTNQSYASNINDSDTGIAVTSEQLAEQHAINPTPIAIPWVPEIDGSAKVYIQRNYLHFDTKIYYRRPDKEEVDIISLNSAKYPINSSAYEFDSDLKTDNQDTEVVDFIDSQNSTQTPVANTSVKVTDNAIDSDFSWQFDDDFLNQDTEKVYTERLFNYPLIQTRRLRSGELHYFDHPLIGILVMIRPYKTEAERQASELDATE